MIEELLKRARADIVVPIDTGWLRVGHVDEIMSFPEPNVALVASPALYIEIAGADPSVDASLNIAIEAKLEIVCKAMTDLGLMVERLPAEFRHVRDDSMHITSVRGNAVNCIYLGRYAIHSQSGPKDMKKRENGGTSGIDDSVAETMKKLGYESFFVDMEAANNEGGFGGNVHCATYTIHSPPQK
jgi:hypothetical protein